MIEARGLGKDFGAVRALDGLDLDVGEAEFFGFLGPNGAGKTTAVHIFATLLAPTRGSARIAGHDVVRESLAVRRSIGLVFQEPTLDRDLTVEENLRFAARFRDLRAASGMTEFLTTHYVEEAETCDRVAVLDRGHLVAQGTPAELKRAAGAGSLEEVFLARTGRPLVVADAAAVPPGPER